MGKEFILCEVEIKVLHTFIIKIKRQKVNTAKIQTYRAKLTNFIYFSAPINKIQQANMKSPSHKRATREGIDSAVNSI